MNRVGHAFFKAPHARGATPSSAARSPGHYYFRDNFYADNGFIPALLILELMSRKGGTLARAAARRCARSTSSPARSTRRSKDVPLKLQELKDRFGGGADGHALDGVSVDFPDWHFNVRPSNTEPMLRLNLEAYSESDMERRRDEVLGLIRS